MGVAFYGSDSTVKKKDFLKCISYIHVNIYMVIHIHIPYIIEKEGRNRPKAEGCAKLVGDPQKCAGFLRSCNVLTWQRENPKLKGFRVQPH